MLRTATVAFHARTQCRAVRVHPCLKCRMLRMAAFMARTWTAGSCFRAVRELQQVRRVQLRLTQGHSACVRDRRRVWSSTGAPHESAKLGGRPRQFRDGTTPVGEVAQSRAGAVGRCRLGSAWRHLSHTGAIGPRRCCSPWAADGAPDGPGSRGGSALGRFGEAGGRCRSGVARTEWRGARRSDFGRLTPRSWRSVRKPRVRQASRPSPRLRVGSWRDAGGVSGLGAAGPLLRGGSAYWGPRPRQAVSSWKPRAGGTEARPNASLETPLSRANLSCPLEISNRS